MRQFDINSSYEDTKQDSIGSKIDTGSSQFSGIHMRGSMKEQPTFRIRKSKGRSSSEQVSARQEIPMESENSITQNIHILKTMMLEEKEKLKKDLESLCQGTFSIIVKGYKQAIYRKYKKIACEIAKNILHKNPSVLLDVDEDLPVEIKEFENELNLLTQKINRDNSNFEYQFNYFKSRLVTLHNATIHKTPEINQSLLIPDIGDSSESESIKKYLEGMTGLKFENQIPLAKIENTSNGHLEKAEQIIGQLKASKILASDENRSKFTRSIILDNNYESAELIWSKEKQNIIDENGLSAKEFHEHCDQRGPTLVLIRTQHDNVFGGVSPNGFESINNYAGSKYAFWFSFSNGKGREPILWKVKPDRAAFAIKNNEAKYSPGFGQSNKSDLFISFKNLKKSYSCLGNTYEFPEHLVKDDETHNTPQTFFSGKETDWDIQNIEVYSLW